MRAHGTFAALKKAAVCESRGSGKITPKKSEKPFAALGYEAGEDARKNVRNVPIRPDVRHMRSGRRIGS